MNPEDKTIFIGFGNMGSAIVKAIDKKKCFKHINVIEPDKNKSNNIQTKTITFHTNLPTDINESKYIWLCVKPQSFKNISYDLKQILNPNHVIISIMAGITKDQIIKQTNHTKVVRIMPNTPAQISKGISVWNATENIDVSERNIIEESLNSFGKSIYVEKEEIINLSTALSGSGPGFFFRILESFIIAGYKSGLDKEVSKKLAIETFIGSAELINLSNSSPQDLRKAVTSPGGTTEAGLNYLENINIDEIITQTISEAVNRGNELSKESEK
jgi:pyrroline-5-carboxylate reductase